MPTEENAQNSNTHYAIQGAPPPANTSHIRRKHLNISYAQVSKSQQLDVYLPDSFTAPYPVIVAIHGGAFMGCDKGDLQVIPMLKGLARGFAVVSINYRMSGEAKFPALVHDAKTAVRWIREHSKTYGFDPARIVAWGGSAGGYLASMLGVSADVKELEDLTLGYANQPCHVQAVVEWYGPTNFLKMDEQLALSGLTPPPDFCHNGPNSPESLLLGNTITRIPDRVKQANPETYIGKNAPPFLIQHGIKDAVVPVQQSIEFAAKLKQAFGDDWGIIELFENAEHADPAFETSDNVDRIFRFLAKFHICQA